MSIAIMEFLRGHNNIKVVEQKYCEPGHSSVQEVDNIHSQIERALKRITIYGPLGLVKALLNVNRKRPFKVVQMREEMFRNFSHVASLMQFKSIPYTQVKALCYRADKPCHIFYKTSFTSRYVPGRVVKHHPTRRNSNEVAEVTIPLAKCDYVRHIINEQKQESIVSMYKFMPAIDITYYNTILRFQKVLIDP